VTARRAIAACLAVWLGLVPGRAGAQTPDTVKAVFLLQTLRGQSVLTVSDAEGFTGRGGMIQFLPDHNRIRLRIDLDAARAANLSLSSKLLRPAEIVGQGEE
jgi:hypothetical protein